MSESASSARGSAYPQTPAELPQQEDSSALGRPVAPSQFAVPPGDEQPTVITQRASIPADGHSDSVSRILHGRILPGERLGHFELLQYVGGGGMGKVFRALDTRLARSVALKNLAPEHAADSETVLRFQNEAQSAARLDHENIARVYYVGEDRGLHYIVFEFIEGVNVRDLVERKGPLPLAEAVSYTLQVAEALGHASERNVVHRDIKPSNLLITPAGQAKLIDMGLARLREVDAAAADLTASGVTLGTFDYISPEQARDPRNTDVRSDIYSLGCTFFFMLAGRPPFPGGTMLQKLLQHQIDQPPDLRQFRPELSEEVNRIVRKMLAKDPGRRYATPIELFNDLLWVARALGLCPAAPGGRKWTIPVASVLPAYYRHLPWVASLLALVAIVIALDFLWRYMPPPADSPPSPSANSSDNGAAGAPSPLPSGGNRATSAAPAAQSPLLPRSEPVAPILPGDIGPDHQLFPGPTISPTREAVPEKPSAEKTGDPTATPLRKNLRQATPGENGDTRPAERPVQRGKTSGDYPLPWIGNDGRLSRATNSC